MMEFPTIYSNRLFLRTITNNDITLILSILSLEEVTRFTVFDKCYDLQDAKKTFNWIKINSESQYLLGLGICRQKESSLIGMIGLANWKESIKECKTAKIWYILGKNYWKQGIMTEALESFLQFIFTHMNILTIKASVVRENYSSHRLLKKFCFKVENHVEENFKGRLCNWDIYSISKNDFIKQNEFN